MRELRRMDKPIRRVMIGGGGNIGRRLALALESNYQVKVIEHNKANAEKLAAELRRALVLAGDVTDEELLESENVGDMDLYCAVTNDDENNIMSALLAKRMGARKVVALDQPHRVCEPAAGRPDRHRDFTGAGRHRHAARARAPWRLRGGPLACGGAPPKRSN